MSRLNKLPQNTPAYSSQAASSDLILWFPGANSATIERADDKVESSQRPTKIQLRIVHLPENRRSLREADWELLDLILAKKKQLWAHSWPLADKVVLISTISSCIRRLCSYAAAATGSAWDRTDRGVPGRSASSTACAMKSCRSTTAASSAAGSSAASTTSSTTRASAATSSSPAAASAIADARNRRNHRTAIKPERDTAIQNATGYPKIYTYQPSAPASAISMVTQNSNCNHISPGSMDAKKQQRKRCSNQGPSQRRQILGAWIEMRLR